MLLLITAAGASSGAFAGSALAAAPSSPQNLKPIALVGFKPEGTLNPSADVLAVVYIPLRNQGLLYSLAKEVSTPGSSLYRKFMSASQAESLFMPSQAQLSAVISQLKSDGLTVIQSLGTSMLLVGGQASKFSSLGLKFEVYDNGSVSYYTAEGESSIQGAQIYASNVTSVLFARPSTLVSGPQIAAMRRLAESENQTFSIEGYSAAKLAKAYNATALYARGINGSGENIGILDFYGDPYIAQQLAYFDGEFGIAAPPSLSIAPIGPYDPNLGISTGWAGEISLDVEASHAMAPGASITLFVANGALPLAYLI
ncbi:MAG: protease pro-enzyme activation domain-containing protein, partial [Conexivisphaerales archaeon]|nr:protease pro-enzyme activation domain-containing protein [Conexivisphaerales archaeon]